MDEKHLTTEQLRTVERLLSKDERVELIPVKCGVKVVRVLREEVKK